VISVIVTVFEQMTTLHWLMQSLAQQTPGCDFEVIICDDGSSQNVLAVVRECAKVVAGEVRYIWSAKRGYRAARIRNEGIRSARGDVMVFIDGDMVLPLGFLAAHREAHRLSTRQPKIVCGSRSWVDVGGCEFRDAGIGEILAAFEAKHRYVDRDMQREWAQSRLPWMACFGCNFSVPRRLEVVFDERMTGWGTEDWDLACGLWLHHGWEIEYSEAIAAHHVEFMSRELVFNTFRRNQHDEIVLMIANHVLLRRKYPEVDLTPAMRGLGRCSLDIANNQWRISEQGVRDEDLEGLIERAENWLNVYHKGWSSR
jgi:glycosyltransferase involved in cell wall biosynthesis